MWPWDFTLTLTLNFQGQIWNLPYLNQKWSDCHEMKSKHIYWILDIKCNHWVWSWPWPWPWIFKVKFWNNLISEIAGPTDIKQKGSFYENHGRDLLVTKMRCKDLLDSDYGDFRCRRAVDSSSWSLLMLHGIIELGQHCWGLQMMAWHCQVTSHYLRQYRLMIN